MAVQRIATLLELGGAVNRSLDRATQTTSGKLRKVTRTIKDLRRESARLDRQRTAEEKKHGRALDATTRKIRKLTEQIREQERAEAQLRRQQERAVRRQRVARGAVAGAAAAGGVAALGFRGVMRREDLAGLAASRGLATRQIQDLAAQLMRRFRVREEQAAAAIAASIEGGDRTIAQVTQRATRGMMLAGGGVGRMGQAPIITDTLSRFEDAFGRALSDSEVSALGAALNTTNVEIQTLSTMLNRNTAVVTSMGGPMRMFETVIAAQRGGFTKPGRFLQTLLDMLTRARISGRGRQLEGMFGQGAATDPRVFMRGATAMIERHGEETAMRAFREIGFTERVQDILKFGRALERGVPLARETIEQFRIGQAAGAFAGARPATGAVVTWESQLTELMGHVSEALQDTTPALQKLNRWLEGAGSGGFWTAALGGVTLYGALKMGLAGLLFRGAVSGAGGVFARTVAAASRAMGARVRTAGPAVAGAGRHPSTAMVPAGRRYSTSPATQRAGASGLLRLPPPRGPVLPGRFGGVHPPLSPELMRSVLARHGRGRHARAPLSLSRTALLPGRLGGLHPALPPPPASPLGRFERAGGLYGRHPPAVVGELLPPLDRGGRMMGRHAPMIDVTPRVQPIAADASRRGGGGARGAGLPFGPHALPGPARRGRRARATSPAPAGRGGPARRRGCAGRCGAAARWCGCEGGGDGARSGWTARPLGRGLGVPDARATERGAGGGRGGRAGAGARRVPVRPAREPLLRGAAARGAHRAAHGLPGARGPAPAR